MPKINLEKGSPQRFVRNGEDIFFGRNHRSILFDLGWTGGDEIIKEELKKRGGIELDMGLILNRGDEIVVGEISQSFLYPPSNIFRITRQKTMEVLRRKYNEDKFIESNN